MWTELPKVVVDVTAPVSSTQFLPPFTQDTILKAVCYSSIPVSSTPSMQTSALILSYIDPSGNEIAATAAGLTLDPAFGAFQGYQAGINFYLIKANQPISYTIQIPEDFAGSYSFLSGYSINFLLEAASY